MTPEFPVRPEELKAKAGVLVRRDGERDPRPDNGKVMFPVPRTPIVAAMHAGAQDYVPKHADLSVMKLKLEKRLEDVAWRRHARDMQSCGERFIGSSALAVALREEVRKIARRSVRVLIRGESGTGKELIAEAIHEQSERGDQRLVRMNGAFGSDELFEDQVFGHERGAFTGASSTQAGRLELAAGGTLFLDEVGKMSLGRQGKLLRVLETSTFERIGGSTSLPSCFRLITASNEDLQASIARGEFGEDFYYRIGEYELVVPPLRHRLDDIPEIARALLDRFARTEGLDRIDVPASALQPLYAHSWPGNVRELDSVLKRAVVLHPGEPLTPDSLALTLAGGPGRTVPATRDPLGCTYQAARDNFDRTFLRSALDDCNGDVVATAKRVGLSRAQLYRRMKFLGLRVKPAAAH